jgi:hypothetical protein
MRNPNTDSRGGQFNQTLINQVWLRGKVILNYDSRVWRYDACGMPIKIDEYGNILSKHGWEVDHMKPVSRGGGDELNNLQPLQWKNNREKGDNYPWQCRR